MGIARGGGAGRINDYTGVSGEAARRIREYGFHSVVAAPVIVGARVWGMLVVATQRPEPLAEGAERRLENFAELVALALGSADARHELAASRARIVEAGDEARRRLERDLHDGAQQRLVALSLTLRLARARLESDPAAATDLLESAGDELAQALEQLREVARGIHPALLSDRGLRPALEALAGRAPFVVDLDVTDERFGHALEVAVYYLVSEALTNAAKHSGAPRCDDGAPRGRLHHGADRRRRPRRRRRHAAAPACAAWPTASPRSAAGSRSTARRAAGPPCAPSCRSTARADRTRVVPPAHRRGSPAHTRPGTRFLRREARTWSTVAVRP